MYTANQYLFASSVEEALQELRKSPSNRVIAGGTWLRMCRLRIGTLIDLSRLSLDRIEEADGEIRIGAMTSLRDVEKSPLLADFCGGILPAAVKDIVGIQFRNSATIGAGIVSAFGFSDPLCALLAMDAELMFAGAGRVKLSDYLSTSSGKKSRDILLSIIIKQENGKGSWQSFRQTATDYSVLNLCAVKTAAGNYRVAVGARPGKAIRCPEAEALLSEGNISQAMRAAAALPFGSNLRGSADYRKALAGVLLEDAAKELEVSKE